MATAGKSFMDWKAEPIAIWALTSHGAALGRRLRDHYPDSGLFCSRHSNPAASDITPFERLRDVLPEQFNAYRGHVFIMAAGIVVRAVAGLLRHKTIDPAVVVLDERGRHAVSLISGHLGGANDLARGIAESIGAEPIITTATDIHEVPSIDLIARDHGLAIENPDAIRHVNMAFLEGRSIGVYDPQGWLSRSLPEDCLAFAGFTDDADLGAPETQGRPGVWIDDIQIDLPAQILILRPPSLFVGIGCNRNTPVSEIQDLLDQVLDQHRLAAASIAGMASIDVKRDEIGLLALAESLERPITFYSREALGAVSGIQSPSAMVAKHVGVKSVCEAAALLAAGNGQLIVPKQIRPNVTMAVVRSASLSSG
jgi:cobalt-precorrin 5A hydrolase